MFFSLSPINEFFFSSSFFVFQIHPSTKCSIPNTTSLRLLVAPTVIIDDSFLRWNICLLFYFQSFRLRLSLTKLYIYFSFEMRGLSFLVYIFSIGFWSKHTEIKPFFSLSSDTNWRGVDVAAGTLTCIFPSSKQNDAVYIL